jgi:hypothetical protein
MSSAAAAASAIVVISISATVTVPSGATSGVITPEETGASGRAGEALARPSEFAGLKTRRAAMKNLTEYGIVLWGIQKRCGLGRGKPEIPTARNLKQETFLFAA